MKHSSFLRRQYIIDHKFQFSFIGYSLGTALLLGGVFFGSIRYFFWQLAAFGEEAGLAKDHVFYQFLEEQTRMMNWLFVVTFLITVLVLSLLGVFLSHKVAGPIYRFRKHLLKIAGGEAPTPVHFREGDWFQELAAAYNDHLKRLAGVNAAEKAADRKDKKAA